MEDLSVLYFVLGAISGLAAVALVCALLHWRKRRRGRACVRYDERQLAEQARAGRMAFLILLALFFISGAMQELGWTDGLSPLTLSAACAWVGLCAYAVRCIRRDAYVSLSERRGALMLVFLLGAAVNLALGLGAVSREAASSFGGVNLATAAGCLCILAALALRALRERRGGAGA